MDICSQLRLYSVMPLDYIVRDHSQLNDSTPLLNTGVRVN